MDKVIFLSKQNCPKCVALKKYLELALKNKYINDIEIIKMEDNYDVFMNYVVKFNLSSMPALIYQEKVLVDTTPLKVSQFLEENLQK